SILLPAPGRDRAVALAPARETFQIVYMPPPDVCKLVPNAWRTGRRSWSSSMMRRFAGLRTAGHDECSPSPDGHGRSKVGDQLVTAGVEIERIGSTEAAHVCRPGGEAPSRDNLEERGLGAPGIDDLASLAHDDVRVLAGRKLQAERTRRSVPQAEGPLNLRSGRRCLQRVAHSQLEVSRPGAWVG